MKLVCMKQLHEPHEVAIFTLYQMLLAISFRPQKRAKVIMITILKYLEPPIVARTILDSAKRTK